MAGFSAGSAFVDLIPRVEKGWDSKVDRETEGAARRIGRRFSSLGKAIGRALALGVAAAGAAAVVGLKKSLDAASDLNEATNVTGLIFKENRAEIDKFVKSSFRLGLSEAKARELSGSIGGLLNNMGLAPKATVEWSKKLLRLGADMGSAFNAEPAEAIEAIGSAIRGETEPIRRFNVVVDQARITAKAQELGLIGVGEELTNTAKAQATLALITEQTSDIQGDFANTSDDAANASRINAARLENLSARIGTVFLPVWTAVLNLLGDKVLPLLEATLPAALGRTRDALKPIGDAAGEVLSILRDGDYTGGAFEEDSPVVSGLFSLRDALGSVRDLLSPVKDRAGELADSLLGRVRMALGGSKIDFETLASAGLEVVADGIRSSIDLWERLADYIDRNREVIIPLTGALTAFAGSLAAVAQAKAALGFLGSIASIIGGIGPALTAAVAAVGGAVAITVAAVLAVVAAIALAYFHIQPFRDFVDRLWQDFQVGWDIVTETVTRWAGMSVRAFQTFMDRARPVAATVGAIVGAIVGWFTRLPDIVGRALSAVGGFVGRYIIDPLRPLGRFIADEIVPTVVAAFDLWLAVWQRVIQVVQFLGQIISAWWSIAGPIYAALARVLLFVAQVLIDYFAAAWNVVSPILTTVLGVFSEVVQTIAGVLVPMLTGAFDFMWTVIQVIWNAVVGIIRLALNTLRGIFQVVTGIISGDWGKAWEGIKTLTVGTLGIIWDFITRTFSTIMDFFGGLPGRVGAIFSSLWEGVKNITSRALRGYVDLIGGILSGIVEFFSRLPGRIADAAGDVFGFLWKSFKSILNLIIRGWNALEFKIPGFDPPGPGPKFGGFTLGLPDIPELRALGGDARAGRSYIVGEEGPELMRMGSTSGHVFSHSDLEDALGGTRGDAPFWDGDILVDARGLEEPEQVADLTSRLVAWRLAAAVAR